VGGESWEGEFVTSISRAVVAVLLLSSASPTLAASPKDFDLGCAVVNGAYLGAASSSEKTRSAALMIWTFYIGRLSGRDDSIDWNAVVLGRTAELKEKALSDSLFMTCMNFYTSKIK
jgi:hypothetical protein